MGNAAGAYPSLVRADQPWVDAELARIYDTLSAPYDEDLAWYHELAAAQGDRVLELACGSGRLLVPLARAGCAVVGLDVSPPMLAIARERLAAAGAAVAARVRLVESHMRAFALDETFDLAVIAARSFAYLLTGADQQRALHTIAAHLRPGGLLAFDLLNPQPAWLAEPPGSLRQDIVYYDAAQGVTIARTEAVVSTDLAAQVRVIRSGYELVRDGGAVTKRFVEWPYRWTYRFEAELLLEQAGFEVAGIYGGYQREPFTAASQWLVLLGRRPT
ncbi:MAG TPA: class I SAM-dependent methyltransferase [Chloroflexota bacterium]|nr:class I SAM-dependent methyltransferase [Chloroflexota bacterium]